MEWSKAVGLSGRCSSSKALTDGHGMVPNFGLDLELVKNDCCFENRFVKKPACWFQSCCSQLAGSQLNGQLAGLAEVGVQHS